MSYNPMQKNIEKTYGRVHVLVYHICMALHLIMMCIIPTLHTYQGLPNLMFSSGTSIMFIWHIVMVIHITEAIHTNQQVFLFLFSVRSSHLIFKFTVGLLYIVLGTLAQSFKSPIFGVLGQMYSANLYLHMIIYCKLMNLNK